MSIRLCLYALLLPLTLLVGTPARADPEYAINFLPSGFRPAQINDTGQIVGTYQNTAAILANGNITSLGGLFPNSVGTAINNAGDVAGTYFGQGAAFAWIGGTAERSTMTSSRYGPPASTASRRAAPRSSARVMRSAPAPFARAIAAKSVSG